VQPASSVRVTLMLADFASAEAGKVNVLGGGWRATPSGVPMQMSICGTIEIDWDATNEPHRLRIELVDGNGRRVRVATPLGEQDFEIGAEFEAGRPPGLPRGTSVTIPLAANFVRPPLPPGAYSFNVFIGDEQITHLSFNVLAIPGGPSPQPNPPAG
jgi:hypothetical protein